MNSQVFAVVALACLCNVATALFFDGGATTITIGTGLALGTGGGAALALAGLKVLKVAGLAVGLALANSGRRGGRGGRRRGRRSAVENDIDATFVAVKALGTDECVQQLVCDIATGALPRSDDDLIANLFDDSVYVPTANSVSFKRAFDFGKVVKNIESCKVQFACNAF